MVFDLLYAWPVYALYRLGLGPPPWDAGRVALVWVTAGVCLLAPALAGALLGELYATRADRTTFARLRRRVLGGDRVEHLLDLLVGRAPAPRAWDHLFAQRPAAYLRVRTTDGQWIGGRFAARSRAGRFPEEPDLFIEEAWPIGADGTFGDTPLGYPLLIPSGTIAYVEVVPDAREEVTADV